jgi:hypothetical protein
MTLTRHQVAGAIAAAEHLLKQGVMPIFNTETVRAIRRRDPELAARLVMLDDWGEP